MDINFVCDPIFRSRIYFVLLVKFWVVAHKKVYPMIWNRRTDAKTIKLNMTLPLFSQLMTTKYHNYSLFMSTPRSSLPPFMFTPYSCPTSAYFHLLLMTFRLQSDWADLKSMNAQVDGFNNHTILVFQGYSSWTKAFQYWYDTLSTANVLTVFKRSKKITTWLVTDIA